MNEGLELCFVCGKSVDMSKLHYTLSEQMEIEIDGESQPIAANLVAVAHRGCRSLE